MDNFCSMAWFVRYSGLEDFIKVYDGTQIVLTHEDFDYEIQVDAGGLGDFFSHRFDITVIPVSI